MTKVVWAYEHIETSHTRRKVVLAMTTEMAKFQSTTALVIHCTVLYFSLVGYVILHTGTYKCALSLAQLIHKETLLCENVQ